MTHFRGVNGPVCINLVKSIMSVKLFILFIYPYVSDIILLYNYLHLRIIHNNTKTYVLHPMLMIVDIV